MGVEISHWARISLVDFFKARNAIPERTQVEVNQIIDFIEESEVYLFRTAESEEIAEELSYCSDLRSLSRLLWRATVDMGFQHFCLFVIKQGDERGSVSRLCTSYSNEWLNYYEDCSYQFIDPIFAEASTRDGSFLFSDTKNPCPKMQSYWDDVDKYRIGKNGFCYSITRPSGGRLGLCFSTNDVEAKAAAVFRLNGQDLNVIVQLAIECFCAVSSGSYLYNDPLTVDELRFLHILATNGSPEKALLLTPTFGGNKALQASIRQKLNVDTVFQAVAIASAMRWFDSLPYNSHDAIQPYPELAGWEFVGSNSGRQIERCDSTRS